MVGLALLGYLLRVEGRQNTEVIMRQRDSAVAHLIFVNFSPEDGDVTNKAYPGVFCSCAKAS